MPIQGEPSRGAVVVITAAAGHESRIGVLLVAADPGILTAVETALAPEDYDLYRARSGAEALRVIATRDLAAILVDPQLRDLADFEADRMLRLREGRPSPPVVFLVPALEPTDAPLSTWDRGLVDYLEMPAHSAVLRGRLAVLAALYRKTVALEEETRKRHSAESRLRGLAARLISIPEEVRAHIAREIHDELGQILTSLRIDVTWLAGQLAAAEAPVAQKIEAMRSLLDSTTHLIRRITTGLRPETLDEMGLTAALSWQAREFEKRMGVRCRLRLPAASPAIDKEVARAMFRIFQEILTNVARHARACEVGIHLRQSPRLLALRVHDDGVGISEEQIHGRDSLGLLGMRERASLVGGQLRIRAGPRDGTTVLVSIPLPAAGKGRRGPQRPARTPTRTRQRPE